MSGSAAGLCLAKLRRSARKEGLDGVILVPGPNIRYFVGVTSQRLERPILLFVPAEGEAHLVAPDFESGPYERLPLKIALHKWNDQEGPSSAFEGLARQLDVHGRWGCEPNAPFGYLSPLRRVADPDLMDAGPILQSLREVKDEEELRRLRRACSILTKSYEKAPTILRPGVTELEAARALREWIYSNGGETCEFCLVQAGERASDPHSEASARKLKAGECVVVDAGCTFMGYNADVTRSFVLGTNVEAERVYARVLEAQEAAIRAARPGTPVGAVDAAARESLEADGLGPFFIHRTGHGLGLEEHESPYIIPKGREVLRRGEAFTIEPGAYLPGKFGVRIEDDVITTSGGREVISRGLPKEFNWWR